MTLPSLCLKWSEVDGDVCLSLKVVLILADSAGPDEMQHYAAFHLGLHCLPKYPFRGFQYTKVKFLYPMHWVQWLMVVLELKLN